MSKFRVYFSAALLFCVLPLTGRQAVRVFPLLSTGTMLSAALPEKAAKSDAKAVVHVNSQTLAAKLIHQVKPSYPSEAREKGIEGAVQFEIMVDEDGQVAEVQVLSGNAMLVSSAYEAIRQWRYESFMLDGKPVRVKAKVTVAFSLDEKRTADLAKGASAASDEAQIPSQPIKLGPGVTPPRVLFRTEPVYTQQARDAKLQGVVVLAMVVSAEGNPQDVRVEKGLGMGLDEAAIEALKQWRFQPAKLNGRLVAIQLTVEVNFVLQ